MLRETGGMCPGGVLFTDQRTGQKFDAPGDFLRDVVAKVVQFRTANPRIFDPVVDIKMLLADFVKQEVAESNCARLGNNPLYCYDTDYKPEVPKSLSEKCSCGVPLQPVMCASCGGGRVIGYLCSRCKTRYDT